jgi:periplasmic divalent cation tolerance protein
MTTDPAPDQVLLVFSTAPDAEAAQRLARQLVEERLAACVNVLPGLRSVYEWQGEVRDEAEVLCLIKTRRSLFEVLRARLEALHPYEVPEIIGVALAEGNAPYLAWVLATATATPGPRAP